MQLLQQQVNANIQVIIVFPESRQDRDGAELGFRSRNTSQRLHLNTTTTMSQPIIKIKRITCNTCRRPVLTWKENSPYWYVCSAHWFQPVTVLVLLNNPLSPSLPAVDADGAADLQIFGPNSSPAPRHGGLQQLRTKPQNLIVNLHPLTTKPKTSL